MTGPAARDSASGESAGGSVGMTLFGHRGSAGEAPENSLGGFAHAWANGVRAFELDVHLSKDGQLVVIHDPNLERTTDLVGWVGDFTAAQLNAANSAAHFPGWPRREGVPCLEEVLDCYKEGILRWQLEIKTDSTERLEQVCPLLASHIEAAGLAERATVTSFDPRALETMRLVMPGQRLALIRSPISMGDIELARSLGCSELCVPLRSGSATLVATAQAEGLQVTGWLGNTAEDLDTLMAWGVDFITSDVPTFAANYLASRT